MENFKILTIDDQQFVGGLSDRIATDSIDVPEALAIALIHGSNYNSQIKTPEQKLEDAMQSIRDFSNNPLKIAALQTLIDEFFHKIDFNALAVGRTAKRVEQTPEELEEEKAYNLKFLQQDYERDLLRVVELLIKGGKYSGKNQIIEEAATLLEYIKQKSLQVVVG